MNIISKCMASTWTLVKDFGNRSPLLLSGITEGTRSISMGFGPTGVSLERRLQPSDPLILALFIFCGSYRITNTVIFSVYIRCQGQTLSLILILKQTQNANIIDTLQTGRQDKSAPEPPTLALSQSTLSGSFPTRFLSSLPICKLCFFCLDPSFPLSAPLSSLFSIWFRVFCRTFSAPCS